MAEDTVESIAYAEALRAIQSQASLLDSLRSRAAALVTAASVLTAFLGGQALAHGSSQSAQQPALTAWSWFAIGSFSALVLFVLVIMFPYKWRSQLSATLILRGAAASRATPIDVQRDLARYLDVNHAANTKVLTRLYVCFGVASAMLVLEAIGWIGDLA